MTEEFEKASRDLEITYEELKEISASILKPILARANNLIEYLDKNIYNLTNDQIRSKVLECRLAMCSLSDIKEKATMKSNLAEALQKQKQAESFISAEGTATARTNIAFLKARPEITVTLLNDLNANSLRAKIDQLNKLADDLKTELITRLSEAKNIGA